LRCTRCGYLMVAERDTQCPRCQMQHRTKSGEPDPRYSKAQVSASATAVATALAPADAPAGIAVYTQCAWQRPDGRWLKSKEIAEMEDLARRYVELKGTKPGALAQMMSKINFRKGRIDSVDKIRERVSEMGIPFGVFQAYANSLQK
jgi:hypothetical protein